MPASTRFARATLTLLGLLCLALWLPIATITYTPGWHQASCDWHNRCNNYGAERAAQRIDELRAFMQHRNALPELYWSAKEIAHLTEVRTLLDRSALLALLGALIFFHAGAPQRAQAARIAMLSVAACIIVLPFFGTFWREIFHPLLFDNRLWQNKPADTSYWVMPRVYFQYTTALVIGVATLICALLRYQALKPDHESDQRSSRQS